MVGIRFRCASALGALLLVWTVAGTAAGGDRLRHDPVVWYERDTLPIAQPEEREPNLLWDGPRESIRGPVKRLLDPVRWIQGRGGPAQNVNALGEVPNSTWFTNRIGLFPFTPDEAARGMGTGEGPDTRGPWTVIRAKTEGVTPGFTVRDPAGDVWLIKFDHPDAPNAGTAAGVITNRLYHAAGYNVPDDVVVLFERDRLVLAEDVRFKLPDGTRRTMTVADLEQILDSVPSTSGRWRALASRYLPGIPIGPFPNEGTREDDANDRVRHEHRRELRGEYLFASWINHFDHKQHNSLDMFEPLPGGGGFVRHYFIDFASTLGTGAYGPIPLQGWEYSIDLPAIVGRGVSVGVHQDAWRTLRRQPGLWEVGYFDLGAWDPLEFKPLVPNATFANFTHQDGYWAAKIITAFSDTHLARIVEQARYENPAATEWVTRVLTERRDRIGRTLFDRVPPLDFWRWDGGVIRFRDLGVERGLYPAPARYRVRAASAAENRSTGSWSPWVELDQPVWTSVPVGDAREFLAVESQVDRGRGWSGSVIAYVSLVRGQVVAVER